MFAPGHLGELTQVVDFALVDAVLEETGTVRKRVRLLPSRVVVYFVLALALFERCGYRAVWSKPVASLDALALVRPCTSALCRARRRVGAAPFQALFETLAGPVAGYPFLLRLRSAGAEFLCRSGARRIPHGPRPLPRPRTRRSLPREVAGRDHVLLDQGHDAGQPRPAPASPAGGRTGRFRARPRRAPARGPPRRGVRPG
nr:transposase domain-containing protein [Streptomyces endocoffeicus]